VRIPSSNIIDTALVQATPFRLEKEFVQATLSRT
jgi:hypothetical protein